MNEYYTFEEWVHEQGLCISRLSDEQLDALGMMFENWLDVQ